MSCATLCGKSGSELMLHKGLPTGVQRLQYHSVLYHKYPLCSAAFAVSTEM